MQKLMFPQEIEVWYVLPSIRKQLALKLIHEGLSQKEVASLMNLTEAAISQYKKEKRAKENFLSRDFNKELKNSVKRIIKDKGKVYSEIIRLNNLVKLNGFLCALHKKKSSLKNKELPCSCCKYNSKED